MMKSLDRDRTLAVWLGGLVLAAACMRTADPLEHYGDQNGRPETVAGGRAPSVAGSSASGGSAGALAASGGSLPFAGGAESSAGEGGDAGSTPLSPTDDACGKPPLTEGPFSRRALRTAAAHCAQWHYCRFEAAAGALADELLEFSTEPTTDAAGRARAAYAKAFELTSENELFQFGPYASQAESAGKDGYQGKGLRELVYAWPLSARCRVEEQVVLETYAQNIGGVLVNARGMFALDYLLFYSGADTECAPSSVTAKTWPTLAEADLAARKRAYAAALADDIRARARALRAAWAADGGNFAEAFVDSSAYPSEQEAMKVLSWALLYIEREVKDWKLGIPAAHTATAPVSVAEAAFSGLKTEAIRANLRGFRALFEGCGANGEGLGFDDWLSEAGHAELAREIVAAYAAAQATADAAPPLDEASAPVLEELYGAVKRLTDLLKNDLFGAGSPLGLTLPKGIEGDTD